MADVIEFVGRALGLTGLKVIDADEACLFLNVVRPAGTKAGDKLPIVFYIYGGAFSYGDVSGSRVPAVPFVPANASHSSPRTIQASSFSVPST